MAGLPWHGHPAQGGPVMEERSDGLNGLAGNEVEDESDA